MIARGFKADSEKIELVLAVVDVVDEMMNAPTKKTTKKTEP
jgi:hypothetical protein